MKMHIRHGTLLALLLFPLFSLAQVTSGPLSLTGTGCVQVSVDAQAQVAMNISGSWSGTIQPEAAIAGQSAANVQVTPSTSSTAASTITASGLYTATVAGYQTFLLCGNTVTGTATVYFSTTQRSASGRSSGGGGATGVTSFSGDGTILSNSASTGDVTATLANTPTGTGGVVLATSPTLVTPALGTPSAVVLTNGTGLPESGVTNLTSDLALKAPLASPTFTGTVTLPASTAFVTPLLGTPTSGVLTNTTGYLWNSLANATGALSLSNGTNATTFNQTSAVNWSWLDTTAALVGAVTNSPVFVIGQKTWNGASVDEQLSSTLITGTGANAAVTQTWATSGSTGGTRFQFKDTSVGNTSTILELLHGTTVVGRLDTAANTDFFNVYNPASTGTAISGFSANASSFTGVVGVALGGQGGNVGYVAPSGTQYAVTIGGNLGSGNSATVAFKPTSGSAKFVGLNVAPVINQTGSATGDYTALQVNVTETAVTGTNKLLADLQVGGTSKFKVDDTGNTTSTLYSTATNCSNAAAPAVCAAAPSGVVAVPTGTNPTLTINTTAVTANSRIFLQIDESATIAATTCNTTLSTLVQPVVTARVANTSFSVQIGAIIATNPACVSYFLVN